MANDPPLPCGSGCIAAGISVLPHEPQSPVSRDHCPAFAGFLNQALAGRTRTRWLWGSQAGSLCRQHAIGRYPKGKARCQVSELPGLVPRHHLQVSPAAVLVLDTSRATAAGLDK